MFSGLSRNGPLTSITSSSALRYRLTVPDNGLSAGLNSVMELFLKSSEMKIEIEILKTNNSKSKIWCATCRMLFSLLRVNGVVVRECSSGNLCMAVSMSILRNVGNMGWYRPSFTEANICDRCPKHGYNTAWVVVDIVESSNCLDKLIQCKTLQFLGDDRIYAKSSSFCFVVTQDQRVLNNLTTKRSDFDVQYDVTMTYPRCSANQLKKAQSGRERTVCQSNCVVYKGRSIF